MVWTEPLPSGYRLRHSIKPVQQRRHAAAAAVSQPWVHRPRPPDFHPRCLLPDLPKDPSLPPAVVHPPKTFLSPHISVRNTSREGLVIGQICDRRPAPHAAVTRVDVFRDAMSITSRVGCRAGDAE